MTLFPFFKNIKGARGIIVGGGKHALEKVERLLPYSPSLEIIAPDIGTKIRKISEIKIYERPFKEEDLEPYPAFVIAAGEDVEENHWIAELCRKKGILVNVVDDREYCDFVFPSLIARGDLSVGICTDGASPAAGVFLKDRFEKEIPDQMEEILEFLHTKRKEMKEVILEKKQRSECFYRAVELCMEKNRPLTDEEWKFILHME